MKRSGKNPEREKRRRKRNPGPRKMRMKRVVITFGLIRTMIGNSKRPGGLFPFLVLIGMVIMIAFHPRISSDTAKLFYDAVILMEQGFYEKAIERLDSVILQDSLHEKAFLMRGVCFQKTGFVDKAILDFKVANSNEPENPDILMFLALGYEEKMDWDTAGYYYRLSYSLDSNLIKAQAGLLKANSELKNWEEVEENASILEKRGYIGPKISYYKGLLYLSNQDTALAKIQFTDALKMDSTYGPASFALANLLYEKGEMDSARAFLDLFIATQKKAEGAAHLLRARVELLSGDTLHALIDLNEVIHLEPMSVQAYVLRAPVKVFFGDFTGACSDLNIALNDSIFADSTLYFYYNCNEK
jgi:tetratricopeptide (TPR) repeat protein